MFFNNGTAFFLYRGARLWLCSIIAVISLDGAILETVSVFCLEQLNNFFENLHFVA